MARSLRTLLAIVAVASFAVACMVTQVVGAPSDGLKHPPTASLKNFEIETVAQGFSEPTSFDYLPDGTLLVTEREGKLWKVSPDGVKQRILDISDHVANQRERGLGTVETAFDFAKSHKVYLSYTYLANPSKPGGPQAMRLTAVTLNPDNTVANPAAPESIVLGKDAKGSCPPIANKLDCPPSIDATHQAGHVVSVPDGSLFVSYGDSNLPSNPGKQDFRVYNTRSTSGKILHIDQQGNGLPGHAFCKKDRNLSHTCTKIFAMGFRNPYRFVLSGEGNPIVSDVGWNTREEISIAEKGKNYGWPCLEGNVKTPFYKDLGPCRKLYAHRKKRRVGGTILSYGHPKSAAGAAVITGPVYPGGLYPAAFNGTLFYGDYAQGFIKRLVKRKKHKGFKVKPVAFGVTPVDFGLSPDHNLTFVDYRRGSVRQLVYAAANKAPLPAASATPSSGLAPLNVQFSSAGTTDPDGDPLFYDWDFADGSGHGNDANPAHVYTTDGTYDVKLTVSDSKGAKASTRVTVTVGNNAPNAQILLPTPNTYSLGGHPTPLRADGSDPDDGALPDSAFRWDVLLHHRDHVHPEGVSTGRNSAFVAVRDHDSDSYYEVKLTVTDSQGLSTILPTVIVKPSIVPLRIGTNLKKVKLSYGGRETKAPRRLKAAIGFAANLSAPKTVTRKGKTFKFKKWSQGGKRAQIYFVPLHASRVKAIYKRVR